MIVAIEQHEGYLYCFVS